MKDKKESLHDLHQRGLRALARELGPVGLIRFLQYYHPGEGDYTRDRDQWLKGVTVEQIASEIRTHRPTRSRKTHLKVKTHELV